MENKNTWKQNNSGENGLFRACKEMKRKNNQKWLHSNRKMSARHKQMRLPEGFFSWQTVAGTNLLQLEDARVGCQKACQLLDHR
jgi:hypothetical protein